MKEVYCWRCRIEMPMLNEHEFAIAAKYYSEGMRNHSVSISNREERFKKLLDYYNELTQFDETEPNAIMHHRLSLYGPACENCGKPYRTPIAKFCAACGNKR
jgi:hypothetical protein